MFSQITLHPIKSKTYSEVIGHYQSSIYLLSESKSDKFETGLDLVIELTSIVFGTDS